MSTFHNCVCVKKSVCVFLFFFFFSRKEQKRKKEKKRKETRESSGRIVFRDHFYRACAREKKVRERKRGCGKKKERIEALIKYIVCAQCLTLLLRKMRKKKITGSPSPLFVFWVFVASL